MVVVDASVIVSTLVDVGREGQWAEAAVADGILIGPELILVEASNILRRLEQAGEISQQEATNAYGDLLQLDLELFPFAPFAKRVWALRNNLTCYDAWYVALAEEFDCPLITLDKRLSRASGPKCEIVIPPWDEREEGVYESNSH
ncbi:MAG: type II toxin-antitoxin system VapC family toxin [Gemmatimonadetes bacterium]|nr:type II toxin-antitoxin system VapC family toxin [Gemmatimonadota bacterium]